MRYAEAGFDLEIDLSRGNIEKIASDPKDSELYLGGQGTAAKILWERVPPEVDPASPRNVLIFSAGLLDGTQAPGANRTSISTIDPQSNLYVNSGLGGTFGPELKHAGYDRIIVTGTAESLVYLWINGDEVEIRDAGHLKGKSPLETAALIRKELKDSKAQVLAIGLAGENGVLAASIDHGNSSASRGPAVVMGDKRLKAIAVRGSKELAVARPREHFENCDRHFQGIYDNPSCGDLFLNPADVSWHANNQPWVHPRGRVKGYWMEELEKQWALRVEREEISWQWENYSQEMEEVHETVVDESRRLRGTGCYNCPKDCHQAVYLPGKRTYLLKSYAKLAYAMAAYPQLQFNYDVLYAMQDCGLDEFATAHLLAFALELHQAGILTEADLPDFPEDAAGRLCYLVERIARREGVGALLAHGVSPAAQQIGKGAEALNRGGRSFGQIPPVPEITGAPYYLMYAVGGKMSITQEEGSFPQLPIPAKRARKSFVKNWEAAPERFKNWFLEWEPGQQLPVEAAVNVVEWNEALHYADDSLGICPLLSSFRGQFGGRPPFHLHNLPGVVSEATGRELDTAGLWQAIARIAQLVRAINVRRGLRRADEKAPGVEWKLDGPGEEEKLLDAYYDFKGWTRDGIPHKATLEALGLGFVSDDLAERGILEGR